MSLKASALKSNDAQKKSIGREVTSILTTIDDELKNAHDQGKHSIIVRAPITFSIPYMNNKDAQRMIYYKILTSLIEREFTVELELQKDISMFHITWLNEEELNELELQNALLAKYTKKNISQMDLGKIPKDIV